MSGGPATPRINVASLMDEKALRAIHMNIEARGATTLAIAEALGIDDPRSLSDFDDFEAELARVFEGPGGDRQAGFIRMVPEIATMLTHPVSLHLVEALGIDTLDIAILSFWSGEALSLDLPGGDCVSFHYDRRNARGGASVHLGEDAVWEYDWDGTSSIETATPIPETLKGAMQGRLLSEVLSHPHLDALDLRIADTEDYAPNGSTVIHLEAVPMIHLGASGEG